MSLIVLPLRSGDDPLDRSVQEVLEEFLTTLRVGTEEFAAGARGAEPALVVPEEPLAWRGDEHQPYVDLGQVVLPLDLVGSEGPDERMRQGLLTALDRALAHRARARHIKEKNEQKNKIEMDDPGIVVLPVMVLPTPGPGSREEIEDAVLQRLDGLGRVVRWLLAAAGELAGGSTGQESETPRDLQLKVVPWLHLPRLPDAKVLPAGLFEGPEMLGSPIMHPVVYTHRAKSGASRDWQGYGRARLLTDLYLLHGLSGSMGELERLFPREVDPGFRWLYSLHSALLEYPLSELLCEVRLASLLSSGAGNTSVLPDPQRLGGLAEARKADVKEIVDQHTNHVRAMIEAGADPARFAFDREEPYPHRPTPRFEGLGPAEHRWQGNFDDALWPIVGPERAADRLHTDVCHALEHCSQASLDKEMDDALAAARKDIGVLRKELEKELGDTLLDEVKDIDKQDRTQRALGRTLAVLRGLRSGLAGIAAEPGPEVDAEAVLEGLRQQRDSWVKEEEALLEAGRSQPSRGGFWLELISVGVAAASVAAMSSVFFLLPLAVGGVLVYLLYRRRHRLLLTYFEAWRMLEKRYLERANQAAADLVGLVTQRTRKVKLLAAEDLQRALAAAEGRFLIELRGLIGLVKTEQAILARKRRIQGEDHRSAEKGRFSYVPVVKADLLGSGGAADFHNGLTSLLTGSLKLTGVPGRVPVQEHEQLIKGLMLRKDDLAVESMFAKEASEAFVPAIHHGTNWDELSDLGILPQVNNGTGFLLLGHGLTERVDSAWKDELQAHGVATWRIYAHGVTGFGEEIEDQRRTAVLHAFTPEVAVVAMVRPWKFQVSGDGEVADG
jgi:hypothetical protein